MEIPGMQPLKDRRKRRMQERVEQAVNAIINAPPSPADPYGSYTGKPLDPQEVPVQDADDL